MKSHHRILYIRFNSFFTNPLIFFSQETYILLKKYDYNLLQKTKNFFCWTVLYVLPEIYEAMSCVNVECSNILNMNLFVSNYGKSMYLLEFESQQQQEAGIVIKYLKEMWLERITQWVRLCLRDISGKKWFDLEQKNHDEYNMINMNRFMSLITYRMQVYLKVFDCIR